jgi:endonuclease III
MATASQDTIVTALLQRHGRTFADELGIDLQPNTPAPLFRLLCAALLFSARIRASTAAAAAKALAEHGWTTPHKLVESTWEQRARVLNRAGYARYDERTATMLGDTAQQLIDRYASDLRNLREEAQRRPEQERALLKQFKGIGDVGADIFLREVQAVWDEVRPFVDRRARAGAKLLGLPDDPQALARLVGDRDFARLVAALVRVKLADDADAVLAHARQAQA